MAKLTIRRATPSDASDVRLLVQQSYAAYIPRMGRRPAPMDQDYAELLQSADAWVAELEREIVGIAIAHVHPDHVLLENLAVLPAAQGHGVGRRLLKVVEDHAAVTGRTPVRLYTTEAMTENLAFYPRQGDRETGRAEQDGFRRVFFSKTISAAP